MKRRKSKIDSLQTENGILKSKVQQLEEKVAEVDGDIEEFISGHEKQLKNYQKLKQFFKDDLDSKR